MNEPRGIDRVWHEAAYFAALVEYLLEHKSDKETDAEIAEILDSRTFFIGILFDVLKSHE